MCDQTHKKENARSV